MRIVGWTFAAFVLILLVDLLVPRVPFRFLGEFGFERGPTGTHGHDVGNYRVQAEWASVLKSARAELEAGGFREVPGDGRIVSRRGSGGDVVTVYMARGAKTAELSPRALKSSSPGWVAVFVRGVYQDKLLFTLLKVF